MADDNPVAPSCPHCHGKGPRARVDGHRWDSAPADAPCPTCGARSPQGERHAAIEDALARLREVLHLLPDDEFAGELVRVRGRAVLIDPRDRPADPPVLTRTCPSCGQPSRPHKFQARMWVCTAEACQALWSVQRGQAVVEPVIPVGGAR
jgi:hypothetical protein